MSEQSNKDLVTNLLSRVYPGGLTAAAIGKRLEALDPRQRSNALYNLKRDGVITLDAETKEYQLRTAPAGYTQRLVKQAANGGVTEKPGTPAPKKPATPWPAPPSASAVKSLVAPRSAPSPERKETESPSALHARVRMAMLKMERQLNQTKPKPVENLDLKIEVLNDLHRLLDPCIKPLLAEIINDLKQREQEAAA